MKKGENLQIQKLRINEETPFAFTKEMRWCKTKNILYVIAIVIMLTLAVLKYAAYAKFLIYISGNV